MTAARRTKSAKQESAANRSVQEAVEEERLKAILESLLFAAAEPVALAQLVTVLETVARDDVKKALGEMALAYASGGRGIVLEEVANGYQLRTPKEHALYVRKLLAAKPPRLSRPLLETVAIVAYRQPITRPEIEQLRGVDCGGVLETLVERRLIQIAGRKEAPGRPIMYTTTREFLELFGLKDLSGLPDLEELRLIETPREEPVFANTDGADPMDPSGGAAAAFGGHPRFSKPAAYAAEIQARLRRTIRRQPVPQFADCLGRPDGRDLREPGHGPGP